MKRAAFPLWLITLAVVLTCAYAPALDAPFIFDDHNAILDNPNIRSLATAWRTPPQSTLSARPLVSITFALNGLNPRALRLTNLAIHLTCAILLFLILTDWSLQRPVPYATATLWALHPLCTEPVIYISQRTELLATLFILATFYAAMRYLRDNNRAALAASAAACALAMMSKEIAFAAPLLVLLYDRVVVSGSFASAWKRHRTLHAALFSTWLILFTLMILDPRSDTAGFGLGVSPLTYLRTQAGVIFMYLKLAVWPADLSITHDVPLATAWTDNLLPGVALTALLVVTLIGCLHKRRPLALAGATFFFILAPSSSLVPIVTEVAAERRMYLPLAALIALVCIIASRQPRGVFIALMIVLVGSATYATYDRATDYRTAVSIWWDAADQYPHSDQALSSLGMAQLQAGDLRAGVTTLEKLLTHVPDDLEAHANLAAAYLLLDDPPRAQHHARRAIALQPHRVAAYVNLGIALARQNRIADAEAAFRAALDRAPQHPEANFHLAKILLLREEFTTAADHLNRTLHMQPDHADAKRLLGLAERLSNQRD